MSLRTLAALATLSLMAHGHAWAQPRALTRPLNDTERASLERGEIVTRPITERRGGVQLFGGVGYQLIEMSAPAVWSALHDRADNIRQMLPQVSSARQLAHTSTTRTIRFEHSAGPANPSYTVIFTYDDARRVLRFTLDETADNDLDVAWGYLRVQPWTEGRSLVALGVMADIGSGLVSDAFRPTVHHWILRIPWTIKRYVTHHRERYEAAAS